VVHETLAPLWNHIDLRHFSVEQKREKWNELLKEDAGIKNDLAKAPLTRFTLAQMTDTEWRFLWSVPELLLDGWSWPIVFGEVASIMNVKTGALAEPATYRSFLEWLSRQDPSAEEKFWRGELEGFSSPTPVPVLCALASCKKGAHVETGIRLESEFVERLTRFCRNHQTTTGALIHAAWILLLARASDRKDILCGTASNGRPDDLAGVETIVGPFINNLPLRLTVQPAQRVAEFIQEVRSKLVNLTAHQHSSISQMQDWSAVPWRQRLFDSLVVFQNFSVDESMRQLGTGARMEDFQGPLHTSYALTLVVSPGACYDVVLAHAEAACPVPHAQLILADWRRLLEALVSNEDASVAQALTVCQLHAGSESVVLQPERAPGGPVPRTPLEKSIAAIWQRAFGIEDITLHDNFFDLGGQSLLMIRVHKRLREELGVNLSIVQLFQHPTVASLAAALEAAQQPAKPEAAITPGGAQGPQSIAIQARNRAAAARAAMARARGQSP
jgi:acyl carrier protein